MCYENYAELMEELISESSSEILSDMSESLFTGDFTKGLGVKYLCIPIIVILSLFQYMLNGTWE